MSEHSKLPWFVSHHTDNGDVVVRGPDKDGGIWDPIITNCTINNANASPETIKANAEYIVRACNAHEKLLAACEEYIKAVDGIVSGMADRKALATLHIRAALAPKGGG